MDPLISRSLKHLYLIHDEDNAANLTPALDPQLAPTQVTLAFAPIRRERAWAIKRTLERYLVPVRLLELEDEVNAMSARARLLGHIEADVAEGEREGRATWALNLSGGSRPVAATAQQLFIELKQPVFYVDTTQDHLHWLWHPALEAREVDQEAHPELMWGLTLANRLTLEPFFESYRARVVSMKPTPECSTPLLIERIAFCDELAARPERYEHALSMLNYLASTAHKELQSPPLTKAQRADEALDWIIDRLEGLKLLRRKAKGIKFANEEARFFANGGWLEELVAHMVRELRASRPSIQDAARGIELMWSREGEEVMNELDVAFLANNQLFIIECKTKRFEGKRSGQAADVIYKLDTLQELLGGVSTRALLVSYSPLKESDLKRAKALNIKVCSGRELRTLREQLDAWVPTPQPRR